MMLSHNPSQQGETLPRRLAVSSALRRAVPHPGAFWPGSRPVERDAEAWLVAAERPEEAPAGAPRWRVTAAPWRPTPFGGRAAAVALLAAREADPLAAGLAAPLSPALRDRARALRPLLAEARIGAAPGLPDPGPCALGCGPDEAVIVLDPCAPAARSAAAAMWRRAMAGAAGRPVIAVPAPEAPPGAAPVLAATRPLRLAPWTLLEAAAQLHALDTETALLGVLAGRAVHCHAPSAYAGWGATTDAPGLPQRAERRSALDLLAALAGATRCADPFAARPTGLEQAIAQLRDWRLTEAENRRIAVCLGMSFWKRRRIAAALASARGAPAFARGTGAALAAAARDGGAVAVWASRAPRDLAARAAAAGTEVIWVEDGFLRSAGLGAGFLPGGSLTLDRRAPYYDPAVATDLEILLATAEFPPALIARAEALAQRLVARGITKYNLAGALPALPESAGRRRILVPGQVEDDLSILRGAQGTVRRNLDLLRAAREAAPDAVILYKPHPDVVAGYRRGAVDPAAARALADAVLPAAPMAPLLALVDEVHTMTSLTGFEALLRGKRVTCWGQPFYAGWGLTEDRAPLPRRRRPLTLMQLVAGTLILFPRYIDPVTELPCSAETLLERLTTPSAWKGGPAAALRRLQGRAMTLLARGRRA